MVGRGPLVAARRGMSAVRGEEKTFPEFEVRLGGKASERARQAGGREGWSLSCSRGDSVGVRRD